MTTTRTLRIVGAGLVSLALVATGTAAAEAKGGRDVRTSGSCSATSDWKPKAKTDDARLQVELEVDSNVVGQTWAVTLKDNGASVYAGSATTVGPSGSFTVSRRIADRAGTDRIVAVATNAATGETCRGALTL